MTPEVTSLSWYLPVPHHPSGRPPRYPDSPILTDNIVPEANGAEGDEGKVEALTEAPALHVAEEHGWEDEDDQGPQGQEESQAQDLQELGEESLLLRPLGRLWKYMGEVWEKLGMGRAISKPPTPSLAVDFGVGLYPGAYDMYVPSFPGQENVLVGQGRSQRLLLNLRITLEQVP